VDNGGSLVYLSGNLYALRGDDKKDFWRHNIAAGTWSTLTSAPQNVNGGGSLTTDGVSVYALRGSGKKDFWKFTVGP
jgi:hypothetical protein